MALDTRFPAGMTALMMYNDKQSMGTVYRGLCKLTDFTFTCNIFHATATQLRVLGITPDIFTIMPATDAFFMFRGKNFDF